MAFKFDFWLELDNSEFSAGKREFFATEFGMATDVDGRQRGFLLLAEIGGDDLTYHIYEAGKPDDLTAIKSAGVTTSKRVRALEDSVLNGLQTNGLKPDVLKPMVKSFEHTVASMTQIAAPAEKQDVSTSVKGGWAIGQIDLKR